MEQRGDWVMEGGAGWRARYAGTMTKRRLTASGRTARRDGFRQTNVETANRERVCAGVFQDSKRIRRFWNTKITPILSAF